MALETAELPTGIGWSWETIEMGTGCSLRHEAGQPRNLCGIHLLELGLDVHLTIVHPERNDLDDSELGHMN